VSTTDTADGSAGAQVVQLVAGGRPEGRPAVGDLIRQLNGKPVETGRPSPGSSAHQPGDTVQVVVDRNGSSRTFSLTLGTSRPTDAALLPGRGPDSGARRSTHREAAETIERALFGSSG